MVSEHYSYFMDDLPRHSFAGSRHFVPIASPHQTTKQQALLYL